jgi:alkaline phosphatase
VTPPRLATALAALLIAPPLARAAVAPEEQDPAFWQAQGTEALAQAQALLPGGPQRARNVILFVGDGMGITTLTAARIFQGQQRGESGERHRLAWESLPFLALSRTYTVDQQVGESAATMSAMMTGVKTRDGLLALHGGVALGERSAEVVAAAAQPTLLDMAEQAGLATGVISTTRLTHATPGACYANSSNRDWEADSDRPEGATVPDIAAQLIDRFGKGGIGDGLEVALSGGRTNFLPRNARDPEYREQRGKRADRRDLTREWRRKFGGRYVFDRAGFEAVDPARTRHLLGLFEPGDMQYEMDRPRDRAGEPSLAEMTRKSIDILARNPKGFFLMVEGGRIDHAHHAGNAWRALSDTAALSDAVAAALAKVDLQDTLVIVTADHSHAFTMGGYPRRGNPVTGLVVETRGDAPVTAMDGKPYTTLGYANGPGMHAKAGGDVVYEQPVHAGRAASFEGIDTTSPDYHQEALVPLEDETHGGEDVAIFAGGPGAQWFHGVQEQSYVFYVMRAALGL